MPIRSREELKRYLEADLAASDRPPWTWRHQISPASRERIMRWQRAQRRLEFWTSQPPSLGLRLRLAVLWRVHLRKAAQLGFTIPLNTFGPGLSIQHYGTITVNENARIGANCRIHPSTTIGATLDGAPVIGDRAYIGAGARITGKIRLGDNVTIAPNAVVTKNCEEDNVIMGGVPARILRREVAYERRP